MLTNADLNKKYDFYNQLFFDNKLSKGVIAFNGRIKRSMGYYSPVDNRIAISKDFLSSKYKPEALDDTLVHEMIHAWQHQILNINGDHRSTFQKMARKINKSAGMHVTTKFDASYYFNDADTQYKYYRINFNKRSTCIASVEKHQIKKFTVQHRYYRVPKALQLPKTNSFREWKHFLEKKCIPVERNGNVITKVDYNLHNSYLLSDILGRPQK